VYRVMVAMNPQHEECQRIEIAVMDVKGQLEHLLERRLPEPVRGAVCPLRGKLNRARLVLTFAAFGGVIRTPAVQIACGVELLHLASLMQDDIVDDAKYRHGCRTVHQLLGAGAAVLLSDWLFGQAYDYFSRSDLVSMGEVNQLVKVMALSELRQELRLGKEAPVSVFHCLRYNYQKTALFFQLCCQLGIALNSRGRQVRVAAGKTGLWWGMAYQLGNDLKDLQILQGNHPVSVDQDRRRGLLTLPLVLLLSRHPELQAELRKLSVAELNRLLAQSGALQDCRQLQKKCLFKAEQYLATINIGGYASELVRSWLQQLDEEIFPASNREAAKH
jgi:heptaprenyl diphosphate synthase